jgi:alpha-1,3-mannosyltransferase
MADQPSLIRQTVRLALDIANGRHALSKLIPPLLFVADALLCSLVIWKVPCKHVPFDAHQTVKNKPPPAFTKS